MGKKLYLHGKNNSDGVDGTFKPQLTSLIDVMTILLVFLIKSFSVEGNLITPSQDLELPVSTAKKTPVPVFTIEITKKSILSEGRKIIDIDKFKANDSLMIPVLNDWLYLQKEKLAGSSKDKEVMIQTDREIEFNVVKRVMYTCSKAGFTDFSVLVFEQEK